MKTDPRTNHPRACVTARRQSWPQGATAGILLVAAACLGLSMTLYHVAGPRDVFAQDTAGR
jgi:hypothetical protein